MVIYIDDNKNCDLFYVSNINFNIFASGISNLSNYFGKYVLLFLNIHIKINILRTI